MKKVSVIVPIYNAEKYLKRCIDSLINQSLKEIEILLVDDCSTDHSRQIIQEYEKKYPNKIIAIYNSSNLGIGKTRNKAIKKASGEYIGFVDSDDYVGPDMYQDYHQFAKQNHLDIVTANNFRVKEGITTPIYSPHFEIASLKEEPSILIKIEYGPCNKIFKRNLIIEHNIFFDETKKYEDMPFVARCLYYAERIGHLKKQYYYYHIHDFSETTTMDQKVYDMFDIMNQVNKLFQKEQYLKEELEMLNIRQFTRYMLQQKYQKNEEIRKQFITDGYQYLNDNFPNWKNNKYYRKSNSIIKRMIKNNESLLRLYCMLFKSKEGK